MLSVGRNRNAAQEEKIRSNLRTNSYTSSSYAVESGGSRKREDLRKRKGICE